MEKHFEGVGAHKEFLYLSNIRNIDKTKLVNYLNELKEKFLKKITIFEKEIMNEQKIKINDNFNKLTNSTISIIQVTSKIISSHSLLNVQSKRELKNLIDFQGQIIDQKSKMKNLWIFESTNYSSVEKNM